MSIPQGVMRVDRLDFTIEPYEWRFAQDHAEKINALWINEVARKPRLFNGQVLLCHRAQLSEQAGERVLQGAFFATDYKSFLAHRQIAERDDPVTNCFGMAALRGADGAYLLGEMAAHTANSGQIYFPAGTPDLDDVIAGQVDLEGSIARELQEETGLSLDRVTIEPGFVILRHASQIACMQVLTLSKPAHQIAEQINQWLAADQRNELCRMHVVQARSEIRPEVMPAFICAFLEHQLG